MVEEKITPNPEGEATPSEASEATPVVDGSQTTPGTEPSAEAGAESYTPEQVAQWQQDATRVKDTQAEITRQQQLNAALQQRQEQLEGALGKFVSREEQQFRNDPVAMAEAELREATESYDSAAIAAATRRLVSAENSVQLPLMQQQLFNQQQAQEQFVRAKDFGDYSADDLVRTRDSLTVDEIALVQSNRDGTLTDRLSARQSREEQAARQAAALNSLYGTGSPGMAPGALNGRPVKTTSFLDLAASNPETRRRVLESEEYDVILEDLPRGMSAQQAAADLLGRQPKR